MTDEADIHPGFEVRSLEHQAQIDEAMQRTQGVIEAMLDDGADPEVLILGVTSALCTLVSYGNEEIRRKYGGILFSPFLQEQVEVRHKTLKAQRQ
jgi:hypothetical protein